MTAKEFLGGITDVHHRLSAAKRKVILYAALAENVSASIGGEQVSHSRDVTANEKAILRLADAHEVVEQLERQQQALENEIVDTLARIGDVEYEELLVYHYVKNIPLPAVSSLMNICRSKIYVKHEQALKMLDIYLSKKETERDAKGCEGTKRDKNSVL